MFISGNYAYLGVGARMVILDISDAAHLQSLAPAPSCPTLSRRSPSWSAWLMLSIAAADSGSSTLPIRSHPFALRITIYLVSVRTSRWLEVSRLLQTRKVDCISWMLPPRNAQAGRTLRQPQRNQRHCGCWTPGLCCR
ncbi:MAG: hypothetical protein IPH87_24530 [Anaerolineae bacterium]|nr:hypothetical protein [Anaerolineae bacterium]